MFYYIIENRIIGYEEEFNSKLYDYPKLNKKQSEFYEKFNCSLEEALKCELNIIYEPTLEELKLQKISEFSAKSFEVRREILEDYKLMNASLGIYNQDELDLIKKIVTLFRDEFYRLKKECENAKDINELNSIMDKFKELFNEKV